MFQRYVASVFIFMLHMFHTYISSVLSECCICLQWFFSVFRCFCNCLRLMVQVFHRSFERMLQVLHMNVSKIDRVLRMLQCDPPAIVARGGGARGRAQRHVGSVGGAHTLWGQVGTDLVSSQSGCRRGRPSGR
jgi:hypothetical protein